jgi:hypothetical protein
MAAKVVKQTELSTLEANQGTGFEGRLKAPSELRANPWWGAEGAKPPEADKFQSFRHLILNVEKGSFTYM